MFLCDHGARVIRVVDSSDTMPRRGGYLVWDRGKECIRLDLSRIVHQHSVTIRVLPMPQRRRMILRPPMSSCCALPTYS